MSVKFAQALDQAPAKVKAIPKAQPKLSEAQTLAGQLIVLHQELSKLDAFNLIKAYEDIKKNLASAVAAESHDPANAVTISCPEGTVTFKAATKRTTVVDKGAMIEALGDALFAQLAEVKVTDLKKYLGDVQVASFTEEVYAFRTLAAIAPSA